jgi:hypothetical protein
MRAGTSPYLLFKSNRSERQPVRARRFRFQGKENDALQMVADGFRRRYGGQHHQLGGGAGALQRQRFRAFMMAATAKYRDDIAGAIVTTGTNTSYAVSSYQGFDTLAHLDGHVIDHPARHQRHLRFAGHRAQCGFARNEAAAPVAGVECQPGTIIQGTPYVTVYNNSDRAFYLQGFYGNPYSVPLVAGLDYWGPIAPNSSLAFPSGQAISRTTYAPLFSMIGTTYGTGDGSTTSNLPD